MLCWASTYSDPYATNTLLYEAIVLDMWDVIYPDITLDKKEREVTADKLVFLVRFVMCYYVYDVTYISRLEIFCMIGVPPSGQLH